MLFDGKAQVVYFECLVSAHSDIAMMLTGTEALFASVSDAVFGRFSVGSALSVRLETVCDNRSDPGTT